MSSRTAQGCPFSIPVSATHGQRAPSEGSRSKARGALDLRRLQRLTLPAARPRVHLRQRSPGVSISGAVIVLLSTSSPTFPSYLRGMAIPPSTSLQALREYRARPLPDSRPDLGRRASRRAARGRARNAGRHGGPRRPGFAGPQDRGRLGTRPRRRAQSGKLHSARESPGGSSTPAARSSCPMWPRNPSSSTESSPPPGGAGARPT